MVQEGVGVLPRQQGDRQRSQAIQIRPWLGPALELLRGHVAKRPRRRHAAQLRVGALVTDRAKIDQHNAPCLGVPDDVGRLDVTVDNRRTALVQVDQGAKQGLQQIKNLRGRVAAAENLLLKRLARDKVRHNAEGVVTTLLGEEVLAKTRNVRMTQLAEDPGLAKRTATSLSIPRT